jgi:hypothetical protein
MISRMSFSDKQARASEKRQAILAFLASGETYTTVPIAARVMRCSVRSATRTLDAPIRDAALKSESLFIQSRRIRLYGITPHGLALAKEFENSYFEVGRTNPSYVPHHLATQQARLAAEAAGWSGWQPGKTLHKAGFLKVPDALATRPDGTKIAIELERHCKATRRYAEVISCHLQEITKKSWAEVHYLTQPELLRPLENIFQRIDTIPVKGERVALEEKHRARFRFFSLAEWPPSQEE